MGHAVRAIEAFAFVTTSLSERLGCSTESTHWVASCLSRACLLLVIHLFLRSSLLCHQFVESPLFCRGPPRWRVTRFPRPLIFLGWAAFSCTPYLNFFPRNLADRECTLNTFYAYIYISCSRYACGPDLDQHPPSRLPYVPMSMH